MECSIQRGRASLNGTFHLSPNENIRSIARMKNHSLFVLYNTQVNSSHLRLKDEKLLTFLESSGGDVLLFLISGSKFPIINPHRP